MENIHCKTKMNILFIHDNDYIFSIKNYFFIKIKNYFIEKIKNFIFHVKYFYYYLSLK